MLNKIDDFEKRMVQILFIIMTVTVLVSVFNRITINMQMAWSEELARYVFVWMVYIGAAACSKTNMHIGVTAFVDLLPKKVQGIFELISYALCGIFALVLIFTTVSVIKVQILYGQITPSLQLPMYFPYFGLVLGGILMLIHYIIHVIEFFKTRRIGG
ncbi:MAG TPA: hypothetical protein DIW17_00210 [Clostridiales bacterium]|nr:hypothetical protein [Clostridiales bacterium]